MPSHAQTERDRITYADDVRAILVGYCTGCHNQRKARNGLVLDSYAGIMQGGSSGAAITKGDANSSLLFQLIARKREPFMPYEEEILAAESKGDVAIPRSQNSRATPQSPISIANLMFIIDAFKIE